MNPATFLRALGPQPWNVAYVEPSLRPKDGRYAENPYRLQHYYQFQVLLKPSPADAQEVYLSSLRAIGIDPGAHDTRFVEDNWEAPTLGAWGTGWEVWLDGMEITQFTYFQQAGGIDLQSRLGRDHVRPRAARHVPAGRRQRVRPGCGRRASPTATCTAGRAPVLDLQLRASPTSTCCCGTSTTTSARPAP